MDYVHDVTPRWERPEHLLPICSLFERIKNGESLFACISVPPQHGKSQTILHGCAQLFQRNPTDTIAYVSYGATIAEEQSRDCQAILRRAGVALNPNALSAGSWQTAAGGRFYAVGVGGPLTSRPITRLLIVDDPYENRQQAESAITRNHIVSWFSSVGVTRIHPGASIIVVHTRWHEDDLIGRLTRGLTTEGIPGWEYVNLPAIADGTDPSRPVGTALWHARPLELFTRIRASGSLTDHDWESMYMGRPRPRGAQLFRGVTYYSELPKTYRVGKGVDLAYTAKSRADHSAGIVVLQADEKFYVAHVERRQLELDQFIPYLVAQSRTYKGVYRFSTSSTEKGIAQLSKLLPADSIRIHGELAMSDKFTHSQRSATEWNAGRIMVPDEAAQAQLRALGLDTDWVKPFVEEMNRFTGVSDREDDQCDALFNAIDTFPAKKSKPPVTGGGFYPGIQHDDLPAGYG